jgi:molybdopterin converting factor small subunit
MSRGITVRFPTMLHAHAGREISIDDPVMDIAGLIAAIDRRIPGLAAELADPIFNVAINDEMLLHGVPSHRLHDGDIVEFVPAIAGG